MYIIYMCVCVYIYIYLYIILFSLLLLSVYIHIYIKRHTRIPPHDQQAGISHLTLAWRAVSEKAACLLSTHLPICTADSVNSSRLLKKKLQKCSRLATWAWVLSARMVLERWCVGKIISLFWLWNFTPRAPQAHRASIRAAGGSPSKKNVTTGRKWYHRTTKKAAPTSTTATKKNIGHKTSIKPAPPNDHQPPSAIWSSISAAIWISPKKHSAEQRKRHRQKHRRKWKQHRRKCRSILSFREGRKIC